MTTEQRIRGALQSPQPGTALRALVGEFGREGFSKAEIVSMLEGFIVKERARADIPEADEETLLDLLDALHGSCHPTAKLDIG